MPLQNRVTPFGEIVAVEGRGLLMGNRGILHDDNRRIVRYAQGRRWIACLTSFRGRRRTIMRPGSYTELFFLDEAVALAAGHRPCAGCRRDDYRRFSAAWASCDRHRGTSADAIDRVIHGDRVAGPRSKRTYDEDIGRLPEGAFIKVRDRAWLVLQDSIIAWSATGYTDRQDRPGGTVTVLTPRSIVDVIGAGYRPTLHPSAGQR